MFKNVRGVLNTSPAPASCQGNVRQSSELILLGKGSTGAPGSAGYQTIVDVTSESLKGLKVVVYGRRMKSTTAPHGLYGISLEVSPVAVHVAPKGGHRLYVQRSFAAQSQPQQKRKHRKR